VDVCDAVAVQAALLAGGALRKDLMTRLARQRPAAVRRYLALELGRVGQQLDHVLPARTVRRINSLGLPATSGGSDESFDRALGRERVPPLPAWVGVLQPSRLRRTSEEELRASPTDRDLKRLGQLEQQDPQQDDETDDEGDESKIVNLLSAPGIPNPLGDAIQKLLGMGRSGRDKNQGSAEIPVGKQRFGPVGRNARKGPLGRLVSVVLEPASVVGKRYPEWDCHKGAYRFDWCAVAEYDPADAESTHDHAARSLLQRPLARVGIEPERHRRQAEGDSLDLSALLDYETDRRHGDNPDPYIYESSRLTRRDLSVLVLLDCSGSTAEDAGGRVVFEEERRLAGDLTVALERLGDRVGTYGFYSRGKDAVRFLRIKSFNARFDSAAKRRLQSVQPSGFTRIGAAIRHATHVLESQALAKNMVLLVIGDGLPYDDGYEDRYARADARQAIKEAVLQGIGVAGIGIRSSTEPEVLEDVWSDASFRVIGQCGDIQRHLRGLLLNALSVTRSNGRRRELLSEEHHGYLRSLHAAKRNAMNTYV
jgi:nitric oxide reductase NorD protein